MVKKLHQERKLLFILPALPEFVPYVGNYLGIADNCKVGYDVICWDRRGDNPALPENYSVYSHPTRDNYSKWKKLLEIFGFYRFVKRRIRNTEYKAVFTYTIADSVLFESYLVRHYRGRYVLDIRDYSPMVRSRFFKRIIGKMLRHSAYNVISSEGFKDWLPTQFDYLVCHNTDIEKVRNSFESRSPKKDDDSISVLTIGALRDAGPNREVIDALGNKEGIRLQFVGDGKALPILVKHCEEHSVGNVSFHGRYQKDEEDGFVKQCDMMNIILDHDNFGRCLMSNRFYLSVRLRKPMIVNEDSFQAKQAAKYGLGLVVSDTSDLYERVVSYWKALDWQSYDSSCVRFLNDTYRDMIRFERVMADFMNKSN